MAACAVPVAPAAPETFSTTTGRFQAPLRRSPTMRAMMAVAPPAGNGTMMRMVFSG